MTEEMEFRLEVVVVPVSDVDRAKAFYSERAGFKLDVDSEQGEMRVVQLTPPGSACSIAIGTGPLAAMEPGSLKGLQLVVSDINAARARLAERGVDVGEVQVFEGGKPRSAREGDDLDIAGFCFFNDPDGNAWAVQQMPARS